MSTEKPTAKSSKSTAASEPTQPLPGQATLAAVPDVPPDPPVLSPAEKKKLGDKFLGDLKAKDDAEAALVAARERCGLSAKAIVDALGHKGPFTIGGRLFTASKGKGTDGFVMREVSGSKENLG